MAPSNGTVTAVKTRTILDGRACNVRTCTDDHFQMVTTPPASPEQEETKSEEPTILPTAISLSAHGSRGGKSIRTLPGDGKTWSIISQGMPNMKFKFPDNKPMRFVQSGQVLNAFDNSAGETGYALNFTLNQMQNVSALTSLFDQYRIEKVEVWILARNGGVALGASAFYGQLLSVIDYDDSTTISAAQAEAYSNCVISDARVGHYRAFVPHIATAAYSGTFTSYANENSPWIDCASSTVQHYGLKAVVTAADVGADVLHFNVFFRLHAVLRNVR